MTLASWEIFYLLIWQVTFQCQFYSLSGCGCSSFLKRVERYEPDIGTLLSAHVLSEGKVLKKDAEAVACDSEDAYCFLSREGGSLLGLHLGKGGSQLWRWVWWWEESSLCSVCLLSWIWVGKAIQAP